jgi:REP element-mobilizing transposase RayT
MKPNPNPSKYRTPLAPGNYYHIYNRGNNKENLFIEARNYAYFLRLYKKYIPPIADTLAYCLLPNHFHFLILMKKVDNGPAFFAKQFASFFGAYSKAFNKAYNRTGRLFEGRYKRKIVLEIDYLLHLIVYIHRNPQRHGFVTDFKKWPYTSFHILKSKQERFMASQAVLQKFGGMQEFRQAHRVPFNLHAHSQTKFDQEKKVHEFEQT